MTYLRNRILCVFAMFGVSCVPGKFASGLNGRVLDSRTSLPVADAKLESIIPHREDRLGGSSFTNQDGEFTLAPEYGMYQLLTLYADWREVVVSKDGYLSKKVAIMQRDDTRRITIDDQDRCIEVSRKAPVIVLLEKKTKG